MVLSIEILFLTPSEEFGRSVRSDVRMRRVDVHTVPSSRRSPGQELARTDARYSEAEARGRG